LAGGEGGVIEQVVQKISVIRVIPGKEARMPREMVPYDPAGKKVARRKYRGKKEGNHRGGRPAPVRNLFAFSRIRKKRENILYPMQKKRWGTTGVVWEGFLLSTAKARRVASAEGKRLARTRTKRVNSVKKNFRSSVNGGSFK